MLRERRETPSLKLDSRRGRGDGLDEKLRDCAHFSQHTILYIKLLEEEIWFHGVLPRLEVVRLLQEDGDFLVRETVRNEEKQIGKTNI